MIFIGIDNGVSGSIGIIEEAVKPQYFKMPVFKQLNYQKNEKWIHRIDVDKFKDLLHFKSSLKSFEIKVLLERPMVNPMAFNASMSGIRALEATLIVIEQLGFPREFIDSKEWQKPMLPKARKTKVTKKGKSIQVIDNSKVKRISLEVGKRLFPSIDFSGFKDADGLLIAEYACRKYKNELVI